MATQQYAMLAGRRVPVATIIETVPAATYRAVLAERDAAEARADSLADVARTAYRAMSLLGAGPAAELAQRMRTDILAAGYADPADEPPF